MPGSPKLMSPGEFQRVCAGMDAFDESFTRRHPSVAFQMAMMPVADDLSTNKHMQMSFTEFLMGLGAVVYMREGWNADEFADLFEELCEDNLRPYYDQLLRTSAGRRVKALQGSPSANPVAPGGGAGGGGKKDESKPTLGETQLFEYFSKMFKEADENGDNMLTKLEFKAYFRDSAVSEKLKDWGFAKLDLEKIFDSLDCDGTGQLSMYEVVAGFNRIRKANMCVGRLRACMVKAFAEADADASGHLSADEFHEVFSRSGMRRKLNRLGIEQAELDGLFVMIDEDGSGEVTVDEVIEGFIRLRNPHAGDRAVAFLRQCFVDGDKDGSGSLTTLEFRQIMEAPKTVEKARRLKLDLADFEGLFSFLDEDDSGEITEAELVDGFQKKKAQTVMASLERKNTGGTGSKAGGKK